MSELDTRKPNNQDDLADVKSLIGNVDAGDFELDDILAEYGGRPKNGHDAIPVAPVPQPPSNVIAFPGLYVEEDEVHLVHEFLDGWVPYASICVNADVDTLLVETLDERNEALGLACRLSA